MKTILETARLSLREFAPEDYGALCLMLRDAETMYAYEHAFSEAEAHAWLQNQLDRYAKYGFGLWAVILKATGELIGQCGLTMQNADEFGEVVGTTPLRSSACRRCSQSSAWATQPPKTWRAATA